MTGLLHPSLLSIWPSQRAAFLVHSFNYQWRAITGWLVTYLILLPHIPVCSWRRWYRLLDPNFEHRWFLTYIEVRRPSRGSLWWRVSGARGSLWSALIDSRGPRGPSDRWRLTRPTLLFRADNNSSKFSPSLFMAFFPMPFSWPFSLVRCMLHYNSVGCFCWTLAAS